MLEKKRALLEYVNNVEKSVHEDCNEVRDLQKIADNNEFLLLLITIKALLIE